MFTDSSKSDEKSSRSLSGSENKLLAEESGMYVHIIRFTTVFRVTLFFSYVKDDMKLII